jgi:LysM repeat protein
LGNSRKASTYPFFIGAIVLLLFVFLSSSHIFSQTRSGLAQQPLSLPSESNLAEFPNQYDFVKSLSDERDKKLVSVKEGSAAENDLPKTYVMKKGDTIFSISKLFNVSIYDLIRANKITNPRRIKVNETIMIPARYASEGSVGLPKGFTEKAYSLPEDISIMATAASGDVPLSTQFFITTKLDPGSLQYLWDLGNDRYSFDANPKNTYSAPGMYDVFVLVSDSYKNEVVSNKVSVEVKKRELRRVRIDSILPRYFTFNQVNDMVELAAFMPKNGQKSAETEITLTQNPEIFKDAGENKYVSVKPGYSELTVSGSNVSYTARVFVSPFPSKHSFEPEYDWYKTQFATGVNGNCGPACVAMAIRWSKGEDIAVAKVRQEIGLPYGNGAIDFSHMDRSFVKHGIRTASVTIGGIDDVKRIVDKGNIAIVAFNTRSLGKTQGSPASNFAGRYYDDITGHYIIIKGYTLDGKYIVAYDPMPSDWVSNETRYSDKTTMLGKNRYYPISQLLTTMESDAIEVTR